MKKAIYSSILGLLIIALGIFMWANPNAFVNILAFIFALYMLFDGFKALISFLKIRKVGNKALRVSMLVKALINIAVALITVIVSMNNKEAILNIVVYLIAANFLLSALVDIADYFMIKRAKLDYGYSSLSMDAVLGFIFGILLIVFPQFIGKAGLVIISVIVIGIGIIACSYGFHSYKMVKVLKSYSKDADSSVHEAEFTEADDSKDTE